MENSKKLIILRHGERTDDANEEIFFNPYDPELTHRGYKQAQSIGHQLLEKFPNLTDKRITFLSSPFIRTMMTTFGILHGLNITDQTIRLEHGICEFLSENMFKENPTDFLEHASIEQHLNNNYESKNKEYLWNILEKIKFESKKSVNSFPSYPETFPEMLNRYRFAVRELINRYLGDDCCDVLVLCTHGYGVQVMVEYLDDQYIPAPIDYCTTFVMEYDQESNCCSIIENLVPKNIDQ